MAQDTAIGTDMTLSDESKAIQKRICSTPFPDDLQGIADDAHVIIARQAFRISQLELPLRGRAFKAGHISGWRDGIRHVSSLFDNDPHCEDTEVASIKRRILAILNNPETRTQ